jgi:hypothetical protein
LSGGLALLRGGLPRLDVRSKTIADAGDGEDKTLTLLAIAKGLPQKKDVLTEVSLLDKGVRPDGVQEFGLFDDATGVLDSLATSASCARMRRSQSPRRMAPKSFSPRNWSPKFG